MKALETQLPPAGKQEAVQGVQLASGNTDNSTPCPLVCAGATACPWRCPVPLDIAIDHALVAMVLAGREAGDAE